MKQGAPVPSNGNGGDILLGQNESVSILEFSETAVGKIAHE